MPRSTPDVNSQLPPFRLVDSGWASELLDGVLLRAGRLRIVCPFIKEGALDLLLELRPKQIQVITRFSLADFAQRVSDLAALRKLLHSGAAVRGIRDLHAKVYLFGAQRAIVTSANLTEAGLAHNPEFGVVTSDRAAIAACGRYFDSLWRQASDDLSINKLLAWDQDVKNYLASENRSEITSELSDHGATARLGESLPRSQSNVFRDAPQAFVKFLGDSQKRPPQSLSTLTAIRSSCCHWAVCYPKNKRPRSVKTGAVIFISRFVEGDTRVFGRAIAFKHEPGRDDATPKERRRRRWKSKWPRYIRVHDEEFVHGTMENGVSLGELMDTLGSNSFATTKRNAANREGNKNPRYTIRRQPHVELSNEGREWLNQRLERAFEIHGKVPVSKLIKLARPDLPEDWRSKHTQ